MNASPLFMQALGGYGQTRPLIRPPMITRPMPYQMPPPGGPMQMPQDAIDMGTPGYLPGGIKPPTMPDQGPADAVPVPIAPEEPGEDGLGQKFLRALGQTIGRARRGSQGYQPFFVRQRTE